VSVTRLIDSGRLLIAMVTLDAFSDDIDERFISFILYNVDLQILGAACCTKFKRGLHVECVRSVSDDVTKSGISRMISRRKMDEALRLLMRV